MLIIIVFVIIPGFIIYLNLNYMGMKKEFLLLSHTLFMALCFSVVFSSCKKDEEPAPEIAVNETAFYIIGEVLSEGKSVDGVTVKTADTEATTDSKGLFELKLTKKGDYSVSFSKNGYIPVSSEVTISSDADNKSSVTIRQALTQRNSSVKVNPDEEAVVKDDKAGVSISIPAGAVKEPVDISMTPFTPGEKKKANGATSASLISLNMDPDGLKFEKPVDILLDNPMGDVAFGNLKHMVEENGSLKEVGSVSFDKEKGSYKATLTGFSNHSFTIPATTSVGGSGTEALQTIVIDNLGSPAVKSESVTVNQKLGWTMDGDAPGSAADVVSSLMGSAPGTTETSVSMSFNVSGDTKQTIEFLAKTEKYTFSFPIINANGDAETINVSVTKYTGSEVNVTDQLGSSHTDHSGGSGQ